MAEETKLLRVRLVTPERTLFENTAEAVELPSRSGQMEALYGHAPLVAELGAGEVVLHGVSGEESGAELRYNVSWGFAEVLPDRVTILASDALKPEEIDVARAQQQLERGQKQLKEAGDNLDAYNRARHVIAEAEAKLATAEKKN
ncbi:MAG: ATP synthase F1 subunit epsilon [Terracidiphilus sp.]